MGNWTPGPWRIDPRPFSGYGAVHVSGGQYIVAKALGQTQSCETEATANARLIAAAPLQHAELIACKQFLEDMHTQTPEWTIAESQKRHEAVCAAIAEATGEQP